MVRSRASSSVACAVWPSCHKNSDVRMNGNVRFSQRKTLAHWFNSIGRSRYELIQSDIALPNKVSEVGRNANGSSNFSSPASVTHGNSGAKPSTWSASFSKKCFGISIGK